MICEFNEIEDIGLFAGRVSTAEQAKRMRRGPGGKGPRDLLHLLLILLGTGLILGLAAVL